MWCSICQKCRCAAASLSRWKYWCPIYNMSHRASLWLLSGPLKRTSGLASRVGVLWHSLLDLCTKQGNEKKSWYDGNFPRTSGGALSGTGNPQWPLVLDDPWLKHTWLKWLEHRQLVIKVCWWSIHLNQVWWSRETFKTCRGPTENSFSPLWLLIQFQIWIWIFYIFLHVYILSFCWLYKALDWIEEHCFKEILYKECPEFLYSSKGLST